MKKKEYKKPVLLDVNTETNLLPAIAVGAALAGGYAIGRVVKSIEIRSDSIPVHKLKKVSI